MGVSHFIEHALFKGTTSRSALAIAQEMDALGGHLNAFTDREHTCFYLRVLSDHLEAALGVLADMVLHPALEAGAMERERQVILELRRRPGRSRARPLRRGAVAGPSSRLAGRRQRGKRGSA
jgi:predicted Zn-dependent peptidase